MPEMSPEQPPINSDKPGQSAPISQTPQPTQVIPKPRANPIAWLGLGFAVVLLFVGVWVLWQNYTKPQTDTSVEPVSEPIVTEEIPGGKTYSNQKYEFQFVHPADWKLMEIEKGGNIFEMAVQVTDPDNGNKTGIPTLIVFVYDNPKQLNLIAYEGEYPSEGPHLPFYRTSGENTTLGNKTALLLKNENCEPGLCDVYLVTNKSKIYSIAVRYDFVEKNIIDQILSTFKFLDIDETVNWKTYRNYDYGFEFSYPSSWREVKNTENYNPTKYGDRTSFFACETSAFAVEYIDNSAPDTPYPNFESYLEIRGAPLPGNSPNAGKEIRLDGLAAKYYEDPGDPGSENPKTRAILFSETSIIDLDYMNSCGESFDQVKSNFDQILSTFRFVDETLIWKTKP